MVSVFALVVTVRSIKAGMGGRGRIQGTKSMSQSVAARHLATVVSLLRNRIYPVSRAEAGDLHEEGGDGGCVCVRDHVCLHGLTVCASPDRAVLTLAWESVFSQMGVRQRAPFERLLHHSKRKMRVF